jgi:urea transporter
MKKEFMAILKGPAQVMFQPKTATGVIILVALFWGAIISHTPEVAFGGLAALVISTLTGYLLGLPLHEGEAGLWGFNGVLVGCAFMTFLGNTPLGWLALVLCSAMTTWVRSGLDRVGSSHKVSSFTFPFVLCTWIFLAASRVLEGLDGVGLSHPMLPAIHHLDTAASAPSSVWEGIEWVLEGVSQIMLIDSWLVGLLFIIALLVSSPWAALWAFVGSAIGTYGALLFGGSEVAVSSGLYGFSPALTAIALGVTFYKPSWRSALWAVLGAAATLFVQAATNVFLEPLGLPALTAPFCLTTWLFLLPLLRFDKHKAEEEDHSTWHRKMAPKSHD